MNSSPSSLRETLSPTVLALLAMLIASATTPDRSVHAATPVTTLEGDPKADGPYAVSFTPDGKRAVVMEGRLDKTIEGNVVTEFQTKVWLTVWDMKTDQPIRTLRPDAEASRGVSFGPGNPGSLSINADGTLLAAIVPPHHMHVWELNTGRLIWNKPTGVNMFHDLSDAAVSFSPTDANQIAFTGTAEEQEGQTGGPIVATIFWAGALKDGGKFGYIHRGDEIEAAAAGGIDRLAFAANGLVITTTGSALPNSARTDAEYLYYLVIWEPLGFPKLIWTSLLTHRDLAIDTQFNQGGLIAHPSQPLVALMGRYSIHMLDLTRGDLTKRISTSDTNADSENEVFDRRFAFSPSGRYVITASRVEPDWDNPTDDLRNWDGWSHAQHRIRIWDLEQQKEVERLFPDKDNYIFMAASPDGRYFAVADGEDVLIFETPEYWRGAE